VSEVLKLARRPAVHEQAAVSARAALSAAVPGSWAARGGATAARLSAALAPGRPA